MHPVSRSRRRPPLAPALALLGALAASFAACASTTPASAPHGGDTLVYRENKSVACTLRLDQDPKACASKGCAMKPELHCSGVEPPPDVVESWRKAEREGSAPCQCICAGDHERCSMVP